MGNSRTVERKGMLGSKSQRQLETVAILCCHCKRFAQSAGPGSEAVSFSRILQYLGLTFSTLGALLEAL